MADQDGDGYGDNASGVDADNCPTTFGTSTELGNLDAVTLTMMDMLIPMMRSTDSTQWSDTDGDGYGDESTGTNPDACPTVAGTSTIDRYGCPDSDADGASDEHLMAQTDLYGPLPMEQIFYPTTLLSNDTDEMDW